MGRSWPTWAAPDLGNDHRPKFCPHHAARMTIIFEMPHLTQLTADLISSEDDNALMFSPCDCLSTLPSEAVYSDRTKPRSWRCKGPMCTRKGDKGTYMVSLIAIVLSLNLSLLEAPKLIRRVLKTVPPNLTSPDLNPFI